MELGKLDFGRPIGVVCVVEVVDRSLARHDNHPIQQRRGCRQRQRDNQSRIRCEPPVNFGQSGSQGGLRPPEGAFFAGYRPAMRPMVATMTRRLRLLIKLLSRSRLSGWRRAVLRIHVKSRALRKRRGLRRERRECGRLRRGADVGQPCQHDRPPAERPSTSRRIVYLKWLCHVASSLFDRGNLIDQRKPIPHASTTLCARTPVLSSVSGADCAGLEDGSAGTGFGDRYPGLSLNC